MGRVVILVGNLALVIAALLCGASGPVRAGSAPQRFDAGTFQAATAKATEYCTTLWSDHAFDPLRDKIPLLGEYPSSSMLINPQRVGPEDKPLADLALKTAEKCNEAHATAWLMLPPVVHAKLLRVKRQADALNTQLSKGKITFGEYNQKNIQLKKQLASAYASLSEGRGVKTAQSAVTVLESKPLPPPKPPVQNAASQTSTPREVRIALVIGESRYVNLPRLTNPEMDARSIAETLQKLGYDTQLLLDAPEDGIRKEIRKFASASGQADVAVVFYAGHGAQLNGSNYLLPIDIDIPHTEADIQFAGLKVDDLINSIGQIPRSFFLMPAGTTRCCLKTSSRDAVVRLLAWHLPRVLCLILGSIAVLAQDATLPSDASMKMEGNGSAVAGSSAVQNSLSSGLDEFPSDIPTNQISKFANSTTPLDVTGAVRGATGWQIYRTVSPAVVLVATKDGFGSGSLLDAAGNMLTNWHVVKGYEYVAVIFKPTVEGKEPTRDDIKRGRVVKYDEIADLALVKVSEVPTGRTPVRLGDTSEIAVGMDVHAIGHPTGEGWTYTTGVISQYRQGYEWKAEGDPIKHKADIIQTQTPINPGNSGGPLLSDSSSLIGVNSFKAGGEGLNFAVAVDEVRKFIARPGNRIEQTPRATKGDRECKPKQLSKFRSEQNDATVVSFDMFCSGKDSGELVTPDDQSHLIIFDLKRSGRWDLSFWDENFTGNWTLVGYHDDGSLKPTRFESYTEFQKRVASR